MYGQGEICNRANRKPAWLSNYNRTTSIFTVSSLLNNADRPLMVICSLRLSMNDLARVISEFDADGWKNHPAAQGMRNN